jgi:hypothetical protein
MSQRCRIEGNTILGEATEGLAITFAAPPHHHRREAGLLS